MYIYKYIYIYIYICIDRRLLILGPHLILGPGWAPGPGGIRDSGTRVPGREGPVSAVTRAGTRAGWDRIVQRCTDSTALHCTALHCTALHSTALHRL